MGYVTRSLVAVLLAIPLQASAASDDKQELENTRWVLVSFVEGSTESPAVEGTQVTLTFSADDQVAGNSGCNSYWGPYKVKGDMLSFESIASTKKGCLSEAAAQQEYRYLNALKSAGSFEITESGLTISYGDGQGELVFTRSQ